MILGGSSLVRYLRLMCSMGSPKTMLLSPPGGLRTFRLDRCWLCIQLVNALSHPTARRCTCCSPPRPLHEVNLLCL